MSTVIEILEELEATSGTNAKRDVLELHSRNELLRSVFLAVEDPYTVYYVNKFKAPAASDAPERDDDSLRNLLDVVLPRLAKREVTGNAAKEYVATTLSRMSSTQQKWATRILLKNLRVGVQQATVNRVWPGLVRGFSVSLAETLRTIHDKSTGIRIMDPVKYPVRVEPKLDGLRCVAVKQAGVVRFYTRNGTLLETLPSIGAALQAIEADDFVLDGECLGEDWNESASILMSRKYKKDDRNIVFHVFDGMPLQDWVAQCSELVLTQRLQYVRDVLEPIVGDTFSKVKLVGGVMVNNELQLLETYSKFMNMGYEGIMLKDQGAQYLFKRSSSILKMKPYTTYEGVIVGHYEGRNGTKNEGLFGGFEVLLPNGVITRVGSGFTDEARSEIHITGPESYVGKIVEIEGQPDPMTKDGLTRDGKVRFPVFCRFRDVSDVDQGLATMAMEFT